MIKQLYLIILIFVLFISCTMPEYYIGKDERILKTIEFWVLYTEYKSDMSVYGVEDYWQYPKETEKLMTGDCEDICIFVIDKIKKEYGLKCDLSILTDGKIHHSVISYDGCFYEPQNKNGKVKGGKFLYETIEYANIDSRIKMKRNK